MIDLNSVLVIIPPVITAVFAYLVARKKNLLDANLSRAKMDAEIQTQTMKMLESVVADMQAEFRREIDRLRLDNEDLKAEIKSSRDKITILEAQVIASDALTASLKSEIHTLNSTVRLLQEENLRLKLK